MSQQDIVTDAPWHLSLPQWVLHNVRTCRIVTSIGDASEELRYAAPDMYACVQKLVDDAAIALPDCELIDFMLTYGLPDGLADLENDINHIGLDVSKLLSVRPTTDYPGTCRLGLLVDTEYRGFAADGTVYAGYWENVAPLPPPPGECEPGEEDMWNDWEEDESVRWYATLPSEDHASETSANEEHSDEEDSSEQVLSEEDSSEENTRLFLGLGWTFVGRLTNADKGDDEGRHSPTTEHRFDPSECSSVTTDSQEHDLDERDEEFMATNLAELSPDTFTSIRRADGTLVHKPNFAPSWQDQDGNELVGFQPTTEDWFMVLHTGGHANFTRIAYVHNLHNKSDAGLLDLCEQAGVLVPDVPRSSRKGTMEQQGVGDGAF